MNKRKIIYSVLAVLLGAFLIVFGGIDDSPGAQLIGLAVIIIDIICLIKCKKKNS
jgi:hypothetical protein